MKLLLLACGSCDVEVGGKSESVISTRGEKWQNYTTFQQGQRHYRRP
jgi:hypothetical protein